MSSDRAFFHGIAAKVVKLTLLQAILGASAVLAQETGRVDELAKRRSPSLFVPINGWQSKAAKANSAVSRSRATKINWHLLTQLNPDGKSTLQFNLFEDVAYAAVFERKETRSPTRYTWFGRLAGIEHGEFILVVEQDVLVASIRAPGQKVFQIRFLGEGLHVIEEIDESRILRCGNGFAQRIEIQPEGETIAGSIADDGSVIDVLFVYTSLARQDRGGEAAIGALIQMAIDESNLAYQNSQINTRIRLAGLAETKYDENGTFADHLELIKSDTDTVMNEVHAMRDAVGADLVCLWVADTGGSMCGKGKAKIMTVLDHSFEDKAFSVVTAGCALNWLTTHELGHNMGCGHERQNPSAPHLYSYSNGWWWTVNNVNNGKDTLHTVMANAPGIRVGYFSNPDVKYDGNGPPTGVQVGQPDEAHNARTINESASTVANFRPSKQGQIWVDFNYTGLEVGTFSEPFNSVSEGVNEVDLNGTVMIKTGSTSETPTITRALTLKAFGGPAVIGTSVMAASKVASLSRRPLPEQSKEALIPAPQKVLTTVTDSTIALIWSPAPKEYLHHFAIYRSTSPGFVPGPENLRASTRDTVFVDAKIDSRMTYYYRLSAFDSSGNQGRLSEEISAFATGVAEGGLSEMPRDYALQQNHPNPFNPETMIHYQLPQKSAVKIVIYDMLGRSIRTLVDTEQEAGYHQVRWDGRDAQGRRLAGGVYFYRLKAAEFRETRKMILLP
jgi:hypothetical protein